MKLFNLKADYHYEGDCNTTKIFMWLSGWSFKKFAIEKLPNDYAVNGDYGPRVAKFDWFELLAKFPFCIALLVIAGMAAIFGILWLCCSIKGLQKSAKRKHSCCRCFTAFLLLMLLLPLAFGSYMTFRANFLLRKHRGNSKRYRDGSRSAPLSDSEFANFAIFKAADDDWNATRQGIFDDALEDFITVLNKSIAEEVIEWQQVIAQNQQTNFEQLKYLHENHKFYKNAVRTLRDSASELLILGLEMDDILRAFFRDATIFLQAKGDSDSAILSKLQSVERLNVWQLNSIYQHYVYLYEFSEYLITAYSDILKLQKFIAEIKPKDIVTENMRLRGQEMLYNPKQRSFTSANENRNLPKLILYLALAMLFITAGLIYVLFVAMGFGTFRYYEEAKCLLKFFICLSFIAIVAMAALTILHFLLTMVLHTEICHNERFGDFMSTKYRSAAATECAPNTDGDESFNANQTRKDLLIILEGIIPSKNSSHFNVTDNELFKGEFLQEKWYEEELQRLLSTENYAPYREYVKQNNKERDKEAKLFLCKFNLIENIVINELYLKEFMPVAALLYETAAMVQKRAQTHGYSNFVRLLEGALSELYIFDTFYALAKSNFLDIMDKKLYSEMQKFGQAEKKLTACSTDYRNLGEGPMRTTTLYTKCGCLEDLLMIYAIGGTIIVLSLFLAMLLSMLLHKLYKRGPANHCYLRPPKTDECAQPAATTSYPCEEAQDSPKDCTGVQDKDCVVNLRGDRAAAPLINTVNFMPPMMGAVGCQPQMGACNQNPQMMCPTPCQPSVQQVGACNQSDGVILPLRSRSKTQVNCAGTSAEAQLVGGGTTRDKTVTVMVFQGPKDRQPLVTYPPPSKLEKK